MEWLKRSLPIYGEEGAEKLRLATVALLGVGGVGSAAAEALVRSGVGNIIIVDNDTIDISNINRQIVATHENVGAVKVEEMKKRMLTINPHCGITAIQKFYLPENSDFLYELSPDYVIDAIDTVTAKLHLIKECSEREIPIISCLGTGNRLHPEMLKVGDISDTVGCGCPLARVMRREIKKFSDKGCKVVYSAEMPYKIEVEGGVSGRHSPASISFVPPVAGYIMASVAVRELLEI